MTLFHQHLHSSFLLVDFQDEAFRYFRDSKGPLVHQCLCSSLLLIDFQDEAFEYFLSACFLTELTNYSVQINWSKKSLWMNVLYLTKENLHIQ